MLGAELVKMGCTPAFLLGARFIQRPVTVGKF